MAKYSISIQTKKGTITLNIPETTIVKFKWIQEKQIGKSIHYASNAEFILAIEKDFQRITTEINAGLWDFDRPISALNIGSGTGVLDLVISKYLNNGSKFWLLDKSENRMMEDHAQWGETDHGFYNIWTPVKEIAEASGIDFSNFTILEPGNDFPKKLDVIKSNRSYMYHYPKDVYWHQILPHAVQGSRLWFDIIYHKDIDFIEEINSELSKTPVKIFPIPWDADNHYADQMININNTRGLQCMWV
jgi:hypothetical protein